MTQPDSRGEPPKIERVARAIYAAVLAGAGCQSTLDEVPPEVQEIWLDAAREAILAMREATSAMVKAEEDLGGPPNRMPAKLVFDVMIVAALSPVASQEAR